MESAAEDLSQLENPTTGRDPYALAQAKQRLRLAEEAFSRVARARDEVTSMVQVEIMRMAKVVAATTSGAAMNRLVLQTVKPRIVIVEEAAEVLESHILTSLSSGCQHLILIGDHQQLRPKAAVHVLETAYDLDVSLFERLVNNGFPKATLELQHRMRPEISGTLMRTPHFYPNLRDDPSVARYPNVIGLDGNLFAFSHKGRESANGLRDTSKKNVSESAMAARLALHLLYQGYTPDKVTVLSGYGSQVSQLRKDLKKQKLTANVLVSTIDNYQGEQNDIVILSLVRSNQEGSIGFLGTPNRVCVGLSRARHGLYILGNFDLLARRSPLWTVIRRTLVEANAIGTHFPIKCRFHGTVQKVKTRAEFDALSPDGGCKHICDKDLSCGHKCERRCHADDRDHENVEPCKKQCLKKCARLHYIHRCPAACSDPCPPCKIPILHQLCCGHVQEVPCYEPTDSLVCEEHCERMCGNGIHDCLADCKDPCPPCYQPALHQLKCGHKVRAPCNTSSDQLKCDKPCDRKCRKGHPCRSMCSDLCPPCQEPRKRRLECGHTQTAPCHIRTRDLTCTQPCKRKCVLKIHDCKEICSAKCPPCFEPTRHRLSCGHTQEAPCSTMINKLTCKEPCQRKCIRGHDCPAVCNDRKPCPPCQHIVSHRLSCGHEKVGLCSQHPEELVCTEPCQRKCKRGVHGCSSKCSNPCPPCPEPYTHTLSCGHEKEAACLITTKNLVCSEPCELKCSRERHACTGICSKTCPPCREMISFTASCGHEYQAQCSLSTIPGYKCQVLVRKPLPHCDHSKDMYCHEDPKTHFCQQECRFQHEGRECQLTCHECWKRRQHSKLCLCRICASRKWDKFKRWL